eukprot:12170606-Heterocapsa_arctica.AAC.1
MKLGAATWVAAAPAAAAVAASDGQPKERRAPRARPSAYRSEPPGLIACSQQECPRWLSDE